MPAGPAIRPTKLLVELGSSNALFYGWLDQDGNLVNVRTDTQIMRIREGSCSGPVVFIAASDKGNSGFRKKNDNESSLTGKSKVRLECATAPRRKAAQPASGQYSPLMEIK